MQTIIKRVLSVTCILFATGIVVGCSTVRTGLVGGTHENIVPFAEQTVISLAAERIDFRDSEFTYLRSISDPTSREIVNLRRLLALTDEFRDAIILYSIELVRIAEMTVTEEEKVEAYADALEAMRQQFSVQLDVDDTEFNANLADIRSQSSLLTAIRTAQLLIDRAGKQFDNLLHEIEEQSLVVAVNHLDDVIESHYSDAMNYIDVLIQRRNEFMQALSLIRDHRLGNTDSAAELRDLSIMQYRSVEIPDSPSQEQLDRLEKYILKQMQRDSEINSYLNIDVEAYLQAHAELDREEAEVLDGLRIARLQMVAWTRSHQAMANGATEPGKWLRIVSDAASAMRHSR